MTSLPHVIMIDALLATILECVLAHVKHRG